MNIFADVDAEILSARMRQAQAMAPFDVTCLPPAQGRALANASALLLNDGQPEVAHIDAYSVCGVGGALRTRVYTPDRACAGAILFVHGGGWFACDVDTHDRLMRLLARYTSRRVIGFDYRLAPEHPFPAGLDDTQCVWRWLQDGPLGILPEQLALAGDSAGANLALALALRTRDAAQPPPAGLALCYGCYAPGLQTASRQRYGDGSYGLSGARMDWYWANYLAAVFLAPPATAAPLHAHLQGLPPVYLGIAECDTLADESRLLATRLEAADVPVQVEVWPRTVHGFLQMTRDSAVARHAVACIARALIGFLSKEESGLP